MLPVTNRLTKKKDFDRIFKSGSGFYNKALGIKALPNDLGVDRYGIIVSTKISKLAVVRNKIKRQIREIIRSEIKLRKGTKDYILIALPPIKALEYIQLKEMIRQNLNKIANIK